ncbi:Transglycosylase-like domain-containing protein [Mycolicibacterium rutilum]|uniref:Transglycosylase-like domain-containing protein n=1 Tax=Mycolicibacterium rutilum TaxID=370526 RepID=A0A1H6KCN4_MYCRU|nr:transglycosylase family protein [Mycolicibacterium rutilum]SEH73259.1 Transglycosylase-like domain-containing protein [Mycolicibacterium rutilum]
MKIRNAVTKSVWAIVIAGALAIVPMVLGSSLATADADSVNWDAIAQCESGGNWATNSGNGHYGGLQFKPATWSANGGVGNPATASRAEQIRVAENVLRTQGLKAWPKCGPRGATPAVWTTPSAPAKTPAAATGCAAMPSSGLFGFVNPRQMCSALLNPIGALTGAR